MDKLNIDGAISLHNKTHKDEINKKKLAERINYKDYSLTTKQQYISCAIVGHGKTITIGFLKELCRVLNVPSDYLLCINESSANMKLSGRKLCNSIDELKKESDKFKSFM